jgi:dihydrofolate reductase
MGKATYDQLSELSDSFPYPDKKCYVFSRTATGRDEDVEFVGLPLKWVASSFLIKQMSQAKRNNSLLCVPVCLAHFANLTPFGE